MNQDTSTLDKLASILKKLSVEEQAHISKLFKNQDKSIALYKEVIKQLTQERNLNKVLLNAVGEGIITVDENHKIINLNPALANMFGYEMHELRMQNLNILLPDQIHSNHAEKMRAFGEQSDVLRRGDKRDDNFSGVHKTNGLFKASISISHGTKGDQKVYFGIVRDLTNQNELDRVNDKKASELKSQAKELEVLYSMVKLREEETIPAIINKLFTQLMPKFTRHPEKAVMIIELDDRTYRSGKEAPVVALSSKLHNGRLTFGFTESIDYGTRRHQQFLDKFTDEFDQTILQVKAKKRELQTERKAAMGELSMGIAHNINNGLQIIQGYAQLSLSLAKTEELREVLGKLDVKTQDLGASVRGILQSTSYNLDRNHFAIFGLGELLSDYLKSVGNPLKSEALRQGKTVTLKEHIGDDTYVNGVKGEVTLVIQTFIKNSIDSLLDDGVIVLDVRRKGGHVLLQVKDNGVGMSEEIQRKIFDPYFTTKSYELGKGLSLNTAQKIAREHGGEISLVESQIGKGTTIELKLPHAQYQEEKKQLKYHLPQEIKNEAPLDILWVDDDIVIRKIVVVMAKALDHQIDFAENGQIAMDMLKQKQYDILITDIGMPVMSGWKLLRNIQGSYENMSRVVASGYVINNSDMQSSGVDFLLNKPFRKADISNLLDEIKSKATIKSESVE